MYLSPGLCRETNPNAAPNTVDIPKRITRKNNDPGPDAAFDRCIASWRNEMRKGLAQKTQWSG